MKTAGGVFTIYDTDGFLVAVQCGPKPTDWERVGTLETEEEAEEMADFIRAPIEAEARKNERERCIDLLEQRATRLRSNASASVVDEIRRRFNCAAMQVEAAVWEIRRLQATEGE